MEYHFHVTVGGCERYGAAKINGQLLSMNNVHGWLHGVNMYVIADHDVKKWYLCSV